MNLENFTEAIQGSEAWPACPSCGAKEMLAAGPFIGCLNCMFTGLIRTFVQQGCDALAHARIKSLSGPNGIYSSLFFGPANLKAQEQNVRENRRVRVFQINALAYSMPVLIEAVMAASKCQMNHPHLVTFPEVGAIARKDILELSDEFQIKHGMIRAASADMSCYLEQVEEDWVEMTVNLIGIPTFVVCAPVVSELSPDFMPQIRYHNISPWHVFGIQPIAWEILPFADGRIYPRYLAALTVRDQMILTLAVCENMNGKPFVQALRRDPANPTDLELKLYEFDDSDEAIVAMKEKFVALKESLGDDVAWAIEREWDLSADIIEIVADLTVREEGVWKLVTEARGGTTFR